MWKQRIIFLSVFIVAAFFLILYPLWFSWYLMVVILLVALFDVALSLPGMLSGSISFAAPEVIEQGEDASLVLTMAERKHFILNCFPALCVKLRVITVCEGCINKRQYVIAPVSERRYEVKIDTSHGGVTVYKIKRVGIISLLGLFCIPFNCVERAVVLVMPPPEKPPFTLTLPQGTILRPKRGGGFSDEHDLRPFRHGDNLRNVHWKVSAKLGSLIVREPLTPLTQSRLILVSKWNTEGQRDLVLGRLRWISEYLCYWKLPHYISLDICGTCAEIKKNEDLHQFLRSALDFETPDKRYHIAVPQGVEWVYRVDDR